MTARKTRHRRAPKACVALLGCVSACLLERAERRFTTVPAVSVATQAPPPAPAPAVIVVRADGELTLDHGTMPEARLLATLRTRMAGYESREIRIAGEAQTPVERVQHMIEGVRVFGFQRIVLASPSLRPLVPVAAHVRLRADRALRVLSIDAAGAQRVGDTLLPEGQLMSRVQALRLVGAGTAMCVRPAGTLPFDRVSDALDVLVRSGVETVFLCAQPTAASEVDGGDFTVRAAIEGDDAQLDAYFPREAVREGVPSARVRLAVTVGVDGRILAATALNDPGFGFARAAERAMLGAGFTATPARDHAGNAVQVVVPFTFHFEAVGDPR